MSVKQVVAEKQRACPAKMHGQMKDIAEGDLLLSTEAKYQTFQFFACFLDIVYFFPNSPLLKGVIVGKLSNTESWREIFVTIYSLLHRLRFTFVLLLNNDLLVDSSVRRVSAV